jgi:hypothetical protein
MLLALFFQPESRCKGDGGNEGVQSGLITSVPFACQRQAEYTTMAFRAAPGGAARRQGPMAVGCGFRCPATCSRRSVALACFIPIGGPPSESASFRMSSSSRPLRRFAPAGTRYGRRRCSWSFVRRLPFQELRECIAATAAKSPRNWMSTNRRSNAAGRSGCKPVCPKADGRHRLERVRLHPRTLRVLQRAHG